MSAPTRFVRAYGDTTDDGMVQLSFTLPVPAGPRAEAAAAAFAGQLGLDPAMVVHTKAVGPEFTFFVVYGRSRAVVDLEAVQVVERDYPLLAVKEVDQRVRTGLGRPLVVLGATVGTDAHTVGLDAILNAKGFAGEKGLEAYSSLRVVNLGAQVPAQDLARRAAEERADAVLVSQVVSQRDVHLRHVGEVVAAMAATNASGQRPLLVVGGPRFEPSAAAALGVDRVFTRGTTPREVASYLVHRLVPARRS